MAESDPREEHVAHLLVDLGRASDAPYRGPGQTFARERATARRRNRVVLAVAAVVTLIAVTAGVVFADRSGTDELRPIQRPPSSGVPRAPSPSPSSSVLSDGPSDGPTSSSPTSPGAPSGSEGTTTALESIDWRNSIVNLPGVQACPATRIHFSDGAAVVDGKNYKIASFARPVYGDVDGDGLSDAVVGVECWAPTGPVESVTMFVAYTGNEKGGPRLLGLVADLSIQCGSPTARLRGTDVVITYCQDQPGVEPEVHRWNGTTFTRVG